uniref:GatB_N domain-containing protein n=1 Tax=Syphacia muris TaxID=451379 RepID=A0A0N5A8F1_9BILA
MFSAAPYNVRGRVNDYVSQFDMAAPGTLPILNRKAVMLGLKTGVLLNCVIPEKNQFERKHYFYADMPAGYQITQQRHPIAHSGYFDIYGFKNYKKRIGISRIQLEIDSGKTCHDLNNNRSLIDLNRAGVALLEIVTEPSLTSALESQCFAEQMLMVLSENFITEGMMHVKFNFAILEGQFRVDANVSLAFNTDELGIRTEIKNLNSLRLVYNAVSYEVFRHFEILSRNGVVVNETRTVDNQGRTLPMRDKEVVTDYRFMPEPNLPFVFIKSDWIDNVKATVNWKPNYLLFITDYGMKWHEAVSIAVSFYFFLQNFLKFFVNVVHYNFEKKISKFTAILLIGQFLKGEINANVDIERELTEKKLWRITDKTEINNIAETVLQNNEATVKKFFKTQNKKLLIKLRNELIKSCGKRVDVADADAYITEALSNLKK